MANHVEPSFEQRLLQLIAEPHRIRHLPTRLVGPFLRLFNYEAEIKTARLESLVNALVSAPPPGATFDELCEQAREEFDDNLSQLERSYLLYHKVNPRLLNWLVRLHTVFSQCEQLLLSQAKGPTDRGARRRVLEASRHKLLPALAVAPSASLAVAKRVASIEPLLAAAEGERDFLGRRRHLLEAARELLLQASADVVHREQAGLRLQHIAREIGDLDRLEALGVKPDVALTHQLNTAWSEASPDRLNAILSTLESQAIQAGDSKVSELTSHALRTLWRGEDRFLGRHQQESLRRSGVDCYQPEVLAAMQRGIEQAKKNYQTERLDEGRLKFDSQFDQVALGYLEKAPDRELIHSALYVDGCVDVGGVLSPHRVLEPVKVIREVRYPTQHLTLSTARSIEDIPDAVVTDPRTVLLDLATKKLLARRYVGQETRHVEHRVFASEVRIFLMDGSGSMLGPRARMRDAIVVAELSTMLARLDDPHRWLLPTLYYRYFTEELGPIFKVQTADEVIEAIEQVLSRLRFGGTDIEGALLDSFRTLREARDSDPQLARAQIVLITDGEAKVDEQAISKARESLGELPIGVSIIALGQENPALRGLAARQREAGERVFYQFLPDAMLRRLVSGERLSLSLHLPEALAKAPLDESLRGVIAEITLLNRKRDDEALAQLHDERAALSDVGLSEADLPLSEQARLLTLAREHEALESRFAGWFPPPGERRAPRPLSLQPAEDDAESIASVCALLATVSEITELIGSAPHQKKLDAVETFERLLLEERLSFVHYQKLLARYPQAFDAALERLHQAVAS